MRRTKIVATAGPAWDRPGVLDGMLAAGVDVVRLNGAHAAREELDRRLADIRAASDRAGRIVAVLLDLPGPKLRVGQVAEGTVLEPGSTFTLVADDCAGDASRACVNYGGLAGDVASGNRILLDDGALELQVTAAGEGSVATTVIRGGPLSSHKGVSVPGVTLGVVPVTQADVELALWAASAGVDWLGQSFVRGPEDVERLRSEAGALALPIVAKVERHEAVSRLADIVDAADAVMVARGDLALETSPERVPVVQRELVRISRDAGKPVIIATQMLESMRTSPRPTRAEASDVATAVFESADAVMLSAESSIGQFPVEAADTMARIVITAEGFESGSAPRPASAGDPTSAVSRAACELAADLGADAIVTATESGATALAVASNRPPVPVVAMTANVEVARRLALVWGVSPAVVDKPESLEAMASTAAATAVTLGAASPGSRVVLTAGTAINRRGTTDLIRVIEV